MRLPLAMLLLLATPMLADAQAEPSESDVDSATDTPAQESDDDGEIPVALPVVPDAGAVDTLTAGYETASVPMADAAQVALMRAWLTDQGGTEETARIFGGVMLAVLGTSAASLGGWLILDPQFHTSADSTPMLVGVLGLGVGVLGLAAGVLSLSSQFAAEDRLQRFATEAEEGLDERELGRFEGELRTYADNVRLTRPIVVAGGVGLALGGGLAMIFTATASHLTESDRVYGYALGGAMALGSLIGVLINAFVESPYERAWRMYQEGLAPDGTTASLHVDVTPFATSTGAGLMAAGTF